MGAITLGEALLLTCQSWGGKVALEDGSGTLLYSELDARSGAVAQALRERGFVRGEPAIVLVSNKSHDWVGVLGLWRAGGVFVPVHRSTPKPALEVLLERTGARVLIDLTGEFKPLGRVSDAALSPVRVLDAQPPAPRQMLDGAAFVVFTSGSTGRPKGVVISHEAFLRKLEALQRVLRMGPDSRNLLVLQMTFSFGIWVSLLTLLQGGTLVMRESFDVVSTPRDMTQRLVTGTAMVPTMLRALLNSARVDVAGALGALADEGVLRQVILGGEPLDPALARRLREAVPGIGLFDVYGTTETSTSDFITTPEDHPALDGTLGRAMPGVAFRVAGDDGSPVAPGEVGELQIRSSCVMNGYLDEPELTGEAFLDGHFRTGDLVRQREDGALLMVGRRKEIISRGGNKISPLEVEAALASHPAVSEAIVTGVPESLMGERIHALVVPVEGERIDEAELRHWVAGRLEKFKLPDAIHFGTRIPRGRTGKADRARFRSDLMEAGAASAGEGP